MLKNIFRDRYRGLPGLGSLLCAFVLFAPFLVAQSAATDVLTGKVIDGSGAAVANAKVTVSNVDTGATRSTATGVDGLYKFEDLPRGVYRLRFEAAGLNPLELPSATVGGTEALVLNEKLESSGQAAGKPEQQEKLPDAPSSSKAPSLSDLGLTPEQTQGNAKEQALLDKRTHMLRIHQRMGLITTIPLIATVILGTGAGGKSEGSATRDLHVALGSLTGDLYGITAYYAIRAPRIDNTPKRGPIRFHEAMAWIHGPGMILTPILGAMAFAQKNNGERVHGLASAHGPVAIVTAGAFGAALVSVSFKF